MILIAMLSLLISVTNLALDKPSWMHSIYDVYVASLAVDGNANSIFNHGSCLHSLAHVYPTWGVDLGAMSAVYHVEVQRRGGALAHGMICGSRRDKKWFLQN